MEQAEETSAFPPPLGRRRAQGQVWLEGVFHKIQNTGRNPERVSNKTVRGLSTHMAAKIASHTLRLLLRIHFAFLRSYCSVRHSYLKI